MHGTINLSWEWLENSREARVVLRALGKASHASRLPVTRDGSIITEHETLSGDEGIRDMRFVVSHHFKFSQKLSVPGPHAKINLHVRGILRMACMRHSLFVLPRIRGAEDLAKAPRTVLRLLLWRTWVVVAGRPTRAHEEVPTGPVSPRGRVASSLQRYRRVRQTSAVPETEEPDEHRALRSIVLAVAG